MAEFVAKEPLILFDIHRSLCCDGLELPEAIEGWWKIDPKRADTYRLALGRIDGEVICAYRPIQGSWCQRSDGRWGFRSIPADDVWEYYVGKTAPDEYRPGRNPVRYLDDVPSG